MSKLEDLKAKIAKLHTAIQSPGPAHGMLFDRLSASQQQRNQTDSASILDERARQIHLLQEEAAGLSRLDKMRLAVTSPGLRDLNKALDNWVNSSVSNLKKSAGEYLSETKADPGVAELKQLVTNASAGPAETAKAIDAYMQHLAKQGNAEQQQSYRQSNSHEAYRAEILINRCDGIEDSKHYKQNSAIKALVNSDLKENLINTRANNFSAQEEELAKLFVKAFDNVRACAANPSPENDKKMQASLDIIKLIEKKDFPAGIASQIEKRLDGEFEVGGLQKAIESIKPLQQELQQRQEQAAKQEAKADPVQNWKAQVAETHAHHRRHHQHHKEHHRKEPTPTKHYDSEVMREKYRQFTEGKLDQKAEVQQDAGNSMRKR